jgi:hypothetical protein
MACNLIAMSSHYPPLPVSDVEAVLKAIGLVAQPQRGTSHQHWTGYYRSLYRKVTVDPPYAPFTWFLVRSMAAQAGLKKKEFYEIHFALKSGKGLLEKYKPRSPSPAAPQGAPRRS